MRKLLAGVVFLFLLQCAFAETVFERSFADMGQGDFVLDGILKKDCWNIDFLLPDDLNVMEQGLYPIASLHAVLYPVSGKGIVFTAYFNDFNLGSFEYASFLCNEQCWKRISLPKKEFKSESNRLRVCTNTTSSVTKVAVKNDSCIGVYEMAHFSDDALKESVDVSKALLGEFIKVRVSIHNTGSEPGFVEIKHVRPIVKEKQLHHFEVVDGETTFNGLVNAGSTAEISYRIKPVVNPKLPLPQSITLQPAIAYFKNVFGEQESIVSNAVTITVDKPESLIEAFIVKKDGIYEPNENVTLELAIKNIGEEPLYNLSAKVICPNTLKFSGQEYAIDAVEPKQTLYIPFTVSSNLEGEFTIGCRVTYVDYNEFVVPCNPTEIVFKKQGLNEIILPGLVLIAIGVAIYIYIRFGK